MKLLKKISDLVFELASSSIYPICRKNLEKELFDDYRSFGVDANNICNARCSFCPYRHNYDKREKGIVDEKVLSHSLDLLRKSGKTSFSFITVLGDPLTDKNFLEKVRFVKKEPQVKDINIYTNLIGLDNFDIDEFVTSGITILNISTCLGGREMYKKLFGVDKYEPVMDNLLRLLQTNKKHGNPINVTLLLRVDYPVDKNYDNDMVAKLREYLTEHKFDILPENMWDDYNGTIKISEIPVGSEFRPNLRDKSIPCYALYRKIQVLYNGDIAVCSCRVAPELVTDNIFNYSSLEDYWKGDKLREYRDNWLKGNIPKICRGCTHYSPYTSITEKMLKSRIKDTVKKILPFR